MPREIKITKDYIVYPESSILIEVGNTKIICNVTIETNVPSYAKDIGKGWVTAEYSMLPRATKVRTRRESVAGKVSGRTSEIQRMIGRSLRAVCDLRKFEGFIAVVDCDVISADGGTRTAAITGSAVALYLAFERYITKGLIQENPMKELVAAISVGVYNNEVVVDLDYEKDANAGVDLNIVMTESGQFVEIQGTGEETSFSKKQLYEMLQQAEKAIKNIIEYQRSVVSG